ncbi:unnamed protein product [Rotaria sp. Silwood1]|nr:unnamed protein product [Rotaria sp. Silwood1]
MFESDLSLDDHNRRKREILTTRLYLLLISLAVAILIFYTSLAVQIQLVTVHKPSQAIFDQLRFNPRYVSTLECPCQNITISYNAFISIKAHYHQLCLSDFVTENHIWISLLYSPRAGRDYSYDDYRHFALPQFRLLAALCTLANETISESIDLFNTNVMINEKVQFHETIESKANATLTQFRISVPRTFVRKLDFIRNIAQGNGIVSSILSNWHILSLNTTFSRRTQWPSLWPEPRSYGNGNCSCATNAMCTSPAAFNGSIVPGFRVGCYPLEALLQSTLECLYNISCINMLRFLYNHTSFTVNPLNSTLSSFNSTVQSLVDRLLVDQWETNVSYEQYYRACTPLSCTYTIRERRNLAYIITSIIGLYGGLTIVLKLIVPELVKIGQYLIMRRRQALRSTKVVVVSQD